MGGDQAVPGFVGLGQRQGTAAGADAKGGRQVHGEELEIVVWGARTE